MVFEDLKACVVLQVLLGLLVNWFLSLAAKVRRVHEVLPDVLVHPVTRAPKESPEKLVHQEHLESLVNRDPLGLRVTLVLTGNLALMVKMVQMGCLVRMAQLALVDPVENLAPWVVLVRLVNLVPLARMALLEWPVSQVNAVQLVPQARWVTVVLPGPLVQTVLMDLTDEKVHKDGEVRLDPLGLLEMLELPVSKDLKVRLVIQASLAHPVNQAPRDLKAKKALRALKVNKVLRDLMAKRVPLVSLGTLVPKVELVLQVDEEIKVLLELVVLKVPRVLLVPLVLMVLQDLLVFAGLVDLLVQRANQGPEVKMELLVLTVQMVRQVLVDLKGPPDVEERKVFQVNADLLVLKELLVERDLLVFKDHLVTMDLLVTQVLQENVAPPDQLVSVDPKALLAFVVKPVRSVRWVLWDRLVMTVILAHRVFKVPRVRRVHLGLPVQS